MTGGHQFAEISDLTFLECLYSSCRTGYFTYHVTRTFLSYRVGDSTLYLCPVFLCQFGKELDRFHFADLLYSRVALTYTVVIRAAVQVVRTMGIADHYFDAL